MNTIAWVAEARRYGTVELQDGRLAINGRFPRPVIDQLMEDREAIREYLAQEEKVVGPDVRAGLTLLRQSGLPVSLARLPELELLALVRHAVRVSRDRAQGKGTSYCPSCGIPLSPVAVSTSCGFCRAHGV